MKWIKTRCAIVSSNDLKNISIREKTSGFFSEFSTGYEIVATISDGEPIEAGVEEVILDEFITELPAHKQKMMEYAMYELNIIYKQIMDINTEGEANDRI